MFIAIIMIITIAGFLNKLLLVSEVDGKIARKLKSVGVNGDESIMRTWKKIDMTWTVWYESESEYECESEYESEWEQSLIVS